MGHGREKTFAHFRTVPGLLNLVHSLDAKPQIKFAFPYSLIHSAGIEPSARVASGFLTITFETTSTWVLPSIFHGLYKYKSIPSTSSNPGSIQGCVIVVGGIALGYVIPRLRQ